MMNTDPRASITPPRVGVAFLLSQVGAHAAIAFAEQLSNLTLKPTDAGILRILGSNPGITQQALSRVLGMFPSRLVVLVDGLERQRLIDRRESSSDRRVYQLHLTKAGRETLTAITQLTTELEDRILASLNEKEKGILSSLLARIVSQQQITPSVHPAYRQIGREQTTAEPGKTFMQTFVTKLRQGSKKKVTGIVVPPEVISALGTSKKPAVKVTLNGYTYRSTVATMGGDFMISLSADNRKAAGLAGDEQVEVKLELDTESRLTEIPADLNAALSKRKALDAFEKLAPSRRNEFVRQVEQAKAPETRQRRISKIVESLQA